MKPTYRLIADGRDITLLISRQLISLELQDSAGMEADTLTLTLNDDGHFAWPSRGAVLRCWLGYQSTRPYESSESYKGRFVVEELDARGPPDEITIHARANEASGLSRVRRTRNWSSYYTLERMIKALAESNELIPAVSARYRDTKLGYWVQHNETDMHMLNRLGRQWDAVAKVKDGRLLFVEQGVARTAGGHEMPQLFLNKTQCSDYQYQERGQDEYDRVGAYYYDYYTVTRTRYRWRWNWHGWWYIVGSYQQTYHHKRRKTVFVGASGSRIHYLRQTFSNEQDAKQAAQAEYARLGRSASTLSLSLQHGQPSLMAEMRLTLNGFRERISEQDWLVSEVRHSLDASSGLQSSVQAVRPAIWGE